MALALYNISVLSSEIKSNEYIINSKVVQTENVLIEYDNSWKFYNIQDKLIHGWVFPYYLFKEKYIEKM